MHRVRLALIVPLLALMVLSDLVALREIRHSLAWIVGDNATLAAVSMLFLANAVTMAFFFDGLSRRSVHLLHGIAFMLYTVVMLAIYASGVEYGMENFPAKVAEQAFGLGHLPTVRIAAFAIGFALAFSSYSFWGVLGTLINHKANTEDTVRWQERAERHGYPTGNIFAMNRPERPTGS